MEEYIFDQEAHVSDTYCNRTIYCCCRYYLLLPSIILTTHHILPEALNITQGHIHAVRMLHNVLLGVRYLMVVWFDLQLCSVGGLVVPTALYIVVFGSSKRGRSRRVHCTSLLGKGGGMINKRSNARFYAIYLS